MDPAAADLPSWPTDVTERRYGIVHSLKGGPNDFEFLPWPIEDVIERWAPPGDAEAASRYVRGRLASMPPERFHWLFGAWPDLDPSRLLYHYTKSENVDPIAASGNLRLSPMHKMNDPREFEPWEFTASWGPSFGATGAHTPTTELANRFRLNSKIIAFGSDFDASLDTVALGDRATLALRPRGYLRPRMWAQYAAGHTGVCLILDRNAVDRVLASHLASRTIASRTSPSKPFHGQVRYTESATGTFDAEVLGDVNDPSFDLAERIFEDDFINAGFLLKDRDWESEHEYRWGLLTASEDPDVIDVPAEGLIVGVVAGLRFDTRYGEALNRLITRFSVPANVGVVRWRQNRLGIDLVDATARP